MSEPRHMSPEEFRTQGHRMVDWIAGYWEGIEGRAVVSRVGPGDVKGALPRVAPEAPGGDAGWDAVFGDLERVIVPGLMHWQHPGFFAYFPSNASGPAVLGELLSAGLGVQGMSWVTSPACTELEERVLDWLVGALGLPEFFLSERGGVGVIQGTASEAVLVAIVAARERARKAGWDGEVPLVAYASNQAHSSVVKAAMVSGIARGAEDRERVRLVGVDASGAMDVGELGRVMAEDVAAGRWPFFVCATLGTTGTLGFDSLRGVVEACDRGAIDAGPWVHVDAAHSGSALVCPEFRWMLDGVEGVDSFCFNPHKWLLTNFDCNCFWARSKQEVVSALSITPEYLRNAATDSGAVTDFRDLQVPLGRRFRSLKLWFVLRHYGLEGLRAHIREHARLAGLFESLVKSDARFEIVGQRKLSLVCFRLRGDGAEADARNKAMLERINAGGRVYLTHTVVEVGGVKKFVVRMAVGGTWTREEHVRGAWDEVQAAVGAG